MVALQIERKTDAIWVVSVAGDRRDKIAERLRSEPYVDSANVFPGYKTQFSIWISPLADNADRATLKTLLNELTAEE